MMYRSLSVCLLSVLLSVVCSVSYAQQANRITGLADAKPGKIRLRWSPAGFIAWEMGNKYGYNVERFTIAVNGVLVEHPTPTLLTPKPLKPYSLDQMEAAAEKDDHVAAVAEMIYSADTARVTPDKGLGAWYESRSRNDWRLAMALLSSDLSVNAAQSAALYLEDTDVKKGERYVYRVALARQPKNLLIDTAFIPASVDEPTMLARPAELAIVCADSAATLGWMTSFSRGMYSAYIIERAVDGKTFKPVSELPILPTAPDARGFSYYKDALPDNDNKYTYRIKGITAFGEYGPYSQTVEGIGVPTIAERPVMDTIIVHDNKRIELRWNLPGKLSQQLTSLIITRSANGKGPFLPLATLKSPATTYTDLQPLNSNYYRIKGITKKGKAIYSFPYFAQVIDDVPPAVPAGLAGKVDSAGIVTLQWTGNTDADLNGYRVFRANSTKEEFMEVTRDILITAAFRDTITIHTLTSNVYYKVIAVDKNYNTSGYSAPLMLTRPDLIAPVRPVMTKAYHADSLGAVVLEWINSPSTDVVRYTLRRFNVADSTKKEMAAWDSTDKRTQYIDKDLQLGNTYFYELTAFDHAGNQGQELSGDIWFETGRRPAVKMGKEIVDKEHNNIKLRWEYDQPAVKQYRIYRAKNDGPYTLYSTRDGDLKEYADTQVNLGNVYKYKITAVLKGDLKAEMSKEVTVVY